MAQKIAIFGGSFNPPALHHREIAELLAREFGDVTVVPCGPRPDKLTVNDVSPVHRAAMADLTFRGIPGVTVDLSDLEQSTFTRTWDLDQEFRVQGEVWHAVGSDLILGGRKGESQIHGWTHGHDLWSGANFVVIERAGFPVNTADLPPHHRLIRPARAGSSSEARRLAFEHQPIDHLVTPEVAAYIARHGLYRGLPPPRASRFRIEEPRLIVLADPQNPEAVALGQQLEGLEDNNHPNLIVVLGGDGTMLGAVRAEWRRRIPFFGVNCGHRGFRLNDVRERLTPDIFTSELVLRPSPLLYVETEDQIGRRNHDLAANDAWVERGSSQAAWIEVSLDGRVVLPKLVGDGVLVATAAGSTAYARAMGAVPLPVSEPALLLVGSNVLEPPAWKYAQLPPESIFEIRNLAPERRPIVGMVDGVSHGQIVHMLVRVSRIAAAEFAFLPSEDLGAKLARLQFPQQ